MSDISLKEMQGHAWAAFLLKQPREVAIRHVIESMGQGPAEMFWDLMRVVHGEDWKCLPEELPRLVNEAIEALEVES